MCLKYLSFSILKNLFVESGDICCFALCRCLSIVLWIASFLLKSQLSVLCYWKYYLFSFIVAFYDFLFVFGFKYFYYDVPWCGFLCIYPFVYDTSNICDLISHQSFGKFLLNIASLILFLFFLGMLDFLSCYIFLIFLSMLLAVYILLIYLPGY